MDSGLVNIGRDCVRGQTIIRGQKSCYAHYYGVHKMVSSSHNAMMANFTQFYIIY